MPSNAMTIGQLIETLEAMRGFHGDLDVVLAVPVDNRIVAMDARGVNVASDVLGRTLAKPVLVFGLSCDGMGRIRNTPGEIYSTDGDDEGWNTDRSQMPEGEDVEIWKRIGGKDIGRRVGDEYQVREGADEWPPRPITIVPIGIMRWRPL